MKNKLYVTHLATTTTYNDLMELFSAHGNVVEINLPTNPSNGRSHGSATVTMATPEGARAAMQALQGQELGKQSLTVSEASPREAPADSSSESRSPRRRSSYLF